MAESDACSDRSAERARSGEPQRAHGGRRSAPAAEAEAATASAAESCSWSMCGDRRGDLTFCFTPAFAAVAKSKPAAPTLALLCCRHRGQQGPSFFRAPGAGAACQAAAGGVRAASVSRRRRSIAVPARAPANIPTIQFEAGLSDRQIGILASASTYIQNGVRRTGSSSGLRCPTDASLGSIT